MADPFSSDTRARAERTGGSSEQAIYDAVVHAMDDRNIRGELAVDFGCGRGGFHRVIAPRFKRYLGVDLIRYEGFPPGADFVEADLNAPPFRIESKSADAVFAVETIEHLENPRALMREMVRVSKPGGWIVVTTPNQRSLLSLGTLLFKGRFSAFQAVHYPAHITALLESDLLQISNELGLQVATIDYSRSGRIVMTALKYPRFVANALPRLCSDNVLLIARRP